MDSPLSHEASNDASHMTATLFTGLVLVLGFLMVWPSAAPYIRQHQSMMTGATAGRSVIERLKSKNQQEGDEAEGGDVAQELLNSVVKEAKLKGSGECSSSRQRKFASFGLAAKAAPSPLTAKDGKSKKQQESDKAEELVNSAIKMAQLKERGGQSNSRQQKFASFGLAAKAAPSPLTAKDGGVVSFVKKGNDLNRVITPAARNRTRKATSPDSEKGATVFDGGHAEEKLAPLHGGSDEGGDGGGGDDDDDPFVFVSDVLPLLQRVVKSPASSATLLVVVANILANPRDEKYRTFRLALHASKSSQDGVPAPAVGEESKFSKQVWRKPSFRALLEALGFHEVHSSPSPFAAAAAVSSSSRATPAAAVVSLRGLSPSRLAVLHLVLTRLRAKDLSAKQRQAAPSSNSSPPSSSSFALLGPGRALLPTSKTTAAADNGGCQERAEAADEAAALATLKRRLQVAANTGLLTLRDTSLDADGSGGSDGDGQSSRAAAAAAAAAAARGLVVVAMRGGSVEGGGSAVANLAKNTTGSLGSVLRVLDLARCGLRGCLDAKLLPSPFSAAASQLPALPVSPSPTVAWCVLKRLNLDHNALTALPWELGNLESLTSLSLNHNRLGVRALGAAVTTTTTVLTLARNDNSSGGSSRDVGGGGGVEAAPSCLPALPPRLSQLGLAGNALKRVPSSVGRCRELREICLDLNRLTAFPSSLVGLPKLERVSIAANFITALPPPPPPPPPQTTSTPRNLDDGDDNDDNDTASPLPSSSSSSTVEEAVTFPSDDYAGAKAVKGVMVNAEASTGAALSAAASAVDLTWFPSLRHLDLSYNRCTPESFPPQVFTHTPLQGLALEGNDPSLSVTAFLELEGVDAFMQRRTKAKNKGVGGCWFAPGGISSFGFCGLDNNEGLRSNANLLVGY